jgi:hypothetical protein
MNQYPSRCVIVPRISHLPPFGELLDRQLPQARDRIVLRRPGCLRRR